MQILALLAFVSSVSGYAGYCSSIEVVTDNQRKVINKGIMEQSFVKGDKHLYYVPHEQTQSVFYVKSSKQMDGRPLTEISDSNLRIDFNKYDEDSKVGTGESEVYVLEIIATYKCSD